MSNAPILTEAALFAMRAPALPKAEETFTVNGEPFKIVIAADGKVNGARLSQLVACTQKALADCGKLDGMPKPEQIGLKVVLPPTMGSEVFVIDNPDYLAQLYILETVAIEPKFSAYHWAIMGRVMGDAQEWERLLDWATIANGLDQYLMRKVKALQDHLGKAKDGNLEPTPTLSTQPVSTSSTTSRKGRSKASR